MLLLNGVLYQCQSGPFWLIVLFKSPTSLLVFYLFILLFIEREELKSPTIFMNLSISACSSLSFALCVLKLLLGSL